jgi:ribosomal protein S18 acetylase RimI-like enzyme
VLALIIDIIDLKEHDITPIRDAAGKEGYNIINRLITEYDSGKNKFDGKGEKLIGFIMDEMIVALCGLNIEPTNIRYGRIRRLYVLPAYRNQNQGIGTELVNHLITYAKHYFEGIVVHIGKLPISHFYESIGFNSMINPSYTHFLML